MTQIKMRWLCVLLRVVTIGALLATGESSIRAAEIPPLATALQPFVDSHTLAGAVMLVASPDKVLTVETVGYSDVAARKPIKEDAVFWIASMSKAMTAAAVMILVDEGKVNLDDPVEKYLPEFKGQMVLTESDTNHVLLKKPVHPITVRNILSHTSGLPFKSALEEPTLDALRLRDAVRSYAITPLQFQPDSRYLYSNAGINTGGRIVEVLSGMSYEAFMEVRLFQPLGMKDTTFWPNERQLKRLAKSYKSNSATNGLEETTVTQLTYPLDDPRRQPMPAGGLFSTAADTARFCQMLLNRGTLGGRRVLSERAVQLMTSVQSGDAQINNRIANYGFGLQVPAITPRPDELSPGSYNHGGAFKTGMWVDPVRQRVFVLMMQHSNFPGTSAARINPTFLKAAITAYGK